MKTQNSSSTTIEELEEKNAINLLPNPEQFVYKMIRYFENEGSIYKIDGHTPIETTAKRLYKDIHEIEAIYNSAAEMIEQYKN
jgi:hypothetical protein